jgi:hypothetical protein
MAIWSFTGSPRQLSVVVNSISAAFGLGGVVAPMVSEYMLAVCACILSPWRNNPALGFSGASQMGKAGIQSQTAFWMLTRHGF